jgi:hypothetical protein
MWKAVAWDTSSDRVDAESKVSGNQANIPARIRRELGIEEYGHSGLEGMNRSHVVSETS